MCVLTDSITSGVDISENQNCKSYLIMDSKNSLHFTDVEWKYLKCFTIIFWEKKIKDRRPLSEGFLSNEITLGNGHLCSWRFMNIPVHVLSRCLPNINNDWQTTPFSSMF